MTLLEPPPLKTPPKAPLLVDRPLALPYPAPLARPRAHRVPLLLKGLALSLALTTALYGCETEAYRALRRAFSFPDLLGLIPVCVSPLLLDLDGKGIATLPETALFDLDGDGRLDAIDRFGSGEGLLVFDADLDGRAGEDGREVFGDRSDVDGDGKPDGFRDGYEALRAFVERARKEGVIAGAAGRARLEERELEALNRRYGLSVRIGGWDGEAQPALEAGVRKLALARAEGEWVRDFDGRGNDRLNAGDAFFLGTDGKVRDFADLWFRLRPFPAKPARAG